MQFGDHFAKTAQDEKSVFRRRSIAREFANEGDESMQRFARERDQNAPTRDELHQRWLTALRIGAFSGTDPFKGEASSAGLAPEDVLVYVERCNWTPKSPEREWGVPLPRTEVQLTPSQAHQPNSCHFIFFFRFFFLFVVLHRGRFPPQEFICLPPTTFYKMWSRVRIHFLSLNFLFKNSPPKNFRLVFFSANQLFPRHFSAALYTVKPIRSEFNSDANKVLRLTPPRSFGFIQQLAIA